MTDAARVEGVALVTGGTGGLGKAVVRELLDAGAHVVTTWLVDSEREAAEEAFGDRDGLTLVEANLLEDGGDVATRTAAEAGPLKALVNLVGGFAAGERLHAEDSPGMEKMLALNLTTAVNASRAAVPAMLDAGGGAIVCVGTKVALQPFSGGAAYAVSKAAVLALVRSLDVEYRDDGIRANAIVPNIIDTPANRRSMPDVDHSRWVAPEEIARVIRFLCSPDSSAVTGAEIPVYGRTR
ncbi:MAG: short-chain dehydrogenase/reductase [Solirubrobacterales bacterium]|jgi:NAD(P)-dependent dehydrogenase (short-subunit alcohol dehydrogenase family)|nr:short-chain dehydrogenase/reductase [Solirubrobacterales bacterium]